MVQILMTKKVDFLLKDTGGGSFINVELERNAPASSTYVVANGYFSVAELVGEHGCVIQSEIA